MTPSLTFRRVPFTPPAAPPAQAAAEAAAAEAREAERGRAYLAGLREERRAVEAAKRRAVAEARAEVVGDGGRLFVGQSGRERAAGFDARLAAIDDEISRAASAR